MRRRRPTRPPPFFLGAPRHLSHSEALPNQPPICGVLEYRLPDGGDRWQRGVSRSAGERGCFVLILIQAEGNPAQSTLSRLAFGGVGLPRRGDRSYSSPIGAGFRKALHRARKERSGRFAGELLPIRSTSRRSQVLPRIIRQGGASRWRRSRSLAGGIRRARRVSSGTRRWTRRKPSRG